MGGINQNILTEKNDRLAGDTELQNNIDKEATERANQDTLINLSLIHIYGKIINPTFAKRTWASYEEYRDDKSKQYFFKMCIRDRIYNILRIYIYIFICVYIAIHISYRK